MGQVQVTKDGQQVILPWEQATGQQIKEQLGIAPDRMVTVAEGGRTRAVADHETATIPPGACISDAPRFRYGYAPAVAERLQAEVGYISAMYRQQAQFGFDPGVGGGRWWVQLPEFYLPTGWRQLTTPILVTVTDHYPSAPPDGFFLSNELRDSRGCAPSHYFEDRSAHNPLSARGWAWFCIHAEGWRPSYDIRDGDSIYKYLTLVHLTMSQVVRQDFRG